MYDYREIIPIMSTEPIETEDHDVSRVNNKQALICFPFEGNTARNEPKGFR